MHPSDSPCSRRPLRVPQQRKPEITGEASLCLLGFHWLNSLLKEFGKCEEWWARALGSPDNAELTRLLKSTNRKIAKISARLMLGQRPTGKHGVPS